MKETQSDFLWEKSSDKLLSIQTFLSLQTKAFMPEEVVQILSKCAAEIEQHLHAIMAPPTNQHVVTIHSLLDAVVQARISRDNMAALRLLHKVGMTVL